MNYTALVGMACAATLGLALLLTAPGQRGRAADVLLAGLAGGLAGARLVYVLLRWSHYAYHPEDILGAGVGGFNWHGAVLGALAAMLLAARLRRADLPALLGNAAPGIPLIAMAALAGCIGAGCAYGREVFPEDAALWLAWEGVDVYGVLAPRYATQALALALLAGPLLLAAWLVWRGVAGRWRCWALLAWLAAVMFGVGFLRGDPVPFVAGLRADQWLDLLILALSLALLALAARRQQRPTTLS
jgi:phosphatidylglycerol:prolipoprotein diacylglycerol transferase